MEKGTGIGALSQKSKAFIQNINTDRTIFRSGTYSVINMKLLQKNVEQWNHEETEKVYH